MTPDLSETPDLSDGAQPRQTIPPSPRIGFQDRMGLALSARTPTEIRGHVDVQPDHLNRGGTAHGGVWRTALDAAPTGVGLWRPHPGRRRRAVTPSLAVNFTGRCAEGRVLIRARKLGGGRRIRTASGEAVAEDGTVLAHAMGSFRHAPGSRTDKGVPDPLRSPETP